MYVILDLHYENIQLHHEHHKFDINVVDSFDYCSYN